MKKIIFSIFFLLLLSLTSLGRDTDEKLIAIKINTDKKVLNPVLKPGDFVQLHVAGISESGKMIKLNPARISYTVKNKLASGNEPILILKGDKAFAGEGGMATVTATIINHGKTYIAKVDITVRPYYRDYHQTLVMKLMMGMEGEPVARLAKEPLFQKKHDVLCTFEEALEVIRKVDNLTMGIPKIIYLVGWQKGGHDHLYPAWNEVNPKLKRKNDSTALESLKWLIREGKKYNTTVSLHINMADAYKSSPLWDEYDKKDILARDEKGNILSSGIQIKGDSMYNVSYTREWEEGLAQKRIDGLIAMVPELKEGHTIHIDVFVAKTEHQPTLSPWHAKPENGGIDIYKEVETQRKIFKYWRERGFDVTGEGLFWAHPPGEGFYGLQPMAWWYPADTSFQMEVPEYLSARGRTDRKGDGDFRFGSSMHGEEIFVQDKDKLLGFLEQFCRTTLPWYYLSRFDRLSLANDTLNYSNGLKAFKRGEDNIIKQGQFILRYNNDLLVPALWKEKALIAYSEYGYTNKSWKLPQNWSGVESVDLYRITANGPQLLQKGKQSKSGQLQLSLKKGMAVYIVPSDKSL